MHSLKMLRCILSFAGIVAESCAQLADRAFARGIVSSSSFVDDAATARGGDLIMSAAALSKYTSSTDISRKSRSKVHAALSLRRSSDTSINYEDFFNIFYSSAKPESEKGSSGGILAQLFGPENAIRLCKGYCCSYTPKVVEAHVLARALSRSSRGMQLSETLSTPSSAAGVAHNFH